MKLLLDFSWSRLKPIIQIVHINRVFCLQMIQFFLFSTKVWCIKICFEFNWVLHCMTDSLDVILFDNELSQEILKKRFTAKMRPKTALFVFPQRGVCLFGGKNESQKTNPQTFCCISMRAHFEFPNFVINLCIEYNFVTVTVCITGGLKGALIG